MEREINKCMILAYDKESNMIHMVNRSRKLNILDRTRY